MNLNEYHFFQSTCRTSIICTETEACWTRELHCCSAAAETKDKCKISKIRQKFLNQNFENMFHIFFAYWHTFFTFRENKRKTVAGGATSGVKKVFSHPGRQIIYNISSAGCKPAAELKKERNSCRKWLFCDATVSKTRNCACWQVRTQRYVINGDCHWSDRPVSQLHRSLTSTSHQQQCANCTLTASGCSRN